MIAEIRQYIHDAIYLVDPDAVAHNQAFTSGNIPDNVIDTTFFIRFNSASPNLIDTDIENSIDVTLEMYNNGFNDVIAAHDELFDKVLSIQSLIVSKKRINQETEIKNVTPSTVTPSPGDSNDNLVILSTSFNFVGYYSSDI